MKEENTPNINQQLYYKLVALWVVCEAFAGGILHGLKLPFTGLSISSFSVLCIVLIAYYVPYKLAIIRATIIVAVFKIMLSPQASPFAYIALFFQGVSGQILLRKKYITVTAVLFGVIALCESAVQRILILIIVYGNSFWHAVDVFIKKLFDYNAVSSLSYSIAFVYVCIHAITGFIVGFYAAKLVRQSTKWGYGFSFPLQNTEVIIEKKKRKKMLPILWVGWILLLLLYIQQFFSFGFLVLDEKNASVIVFRSIFIILTWMIIVSPLLMKIINNNLNDAKKKYQVEIAAIIKLLPSTKILIRESWRRAKISKENRWKVFFRNVIANTIYPIQF